MITVWIWPNVKANVEKQISAVIGKNWFLMQGPQIITIPAFDSNRFWIIPLQDAYTNTYATLGSGSNTAPGQYLIVGRSKLLASLAVAAHKEAACQANLMYIPYACGSTCLGIVTDPALVL